MQVVRHRGDKEKGARATSISITPINIALAVGMKQSHTGIMWTTWWRGICTIRMVPTATIMARSPSKADQTAGRCS